MSLFTVSANKVFDKLLEKATSPLLLESDWESILQLCDLVKAQEITAKYAVQAIKKKFGHENAHVILSALLCMESVVKNCGGSVHKEVAQKDIVDALRELAKNGPDTIRDKVLELIQCWSYGLGQQYKIFTETYNSMKTESYRFPPLKESEAMFETGDVAPDWRDAKECFRCRQTFTTFNRKHHCRSCGDIFCDKCSSKQCPIIRYGMDRDVRVCDACFEKLTNPSIAAATATSSSAVSKLVPSAKPLASTSSGAPKPTKTQAELDEEEAFQLALAISQSEAEDKERQKKMLTQKYAMSSFLSDNSTTQSTPTRSNTESNNSVSVPPTQEYTVDNNGYAELSKYLERGHYEQQQQKLTGTETNSTAVPSTIQNGHNGGESTFQLPNQLENFISDREIDQFTLMVTDHIKNFKFRMLSNQQRSRNVTTDTAVQSVFVMLQHLHPELHRFMQLLEDKRAYYEGLQDKLSQLKDAREALNALRTDHYERKQREALERERQRQIQLAQKLDTMRQKKQEYLEYQRQIHLQRLAQQEQEMKTRLEQQRHLALAREQLNQNPHLSMATYDYGQLPQQSVPYQQPPYGNSQYQQPFDPTGQYSTMYPPSLPSQQPPPSHYATMMAYPPQTDAQVLPPPPVNYSMATGDNNYAVPGHQLPITNSPATYAQQPNPIVNEQKPEPQLITFD